jgi:hypothetical protein
MRPPALPLYCCAIVLGFTSSFAATQVSPPAASEHSLRASSDSVIEELPRSLTAATDAAVSAAEIPATRSSFTARWEPISGATKYRLDVSTSPAFTHCVPGYCGRDVGLVTWWVVTGLAPNTTYYYRVSAGGAANTFTAQSVVPTGSATTASGSGLIISPTYDSSVTSHPNAAAIEAMIGRAISLYESMFADQITVSILFRYSTTRPNGTPIGNANMIALSNYVVYSPPWSTYIDALRADAKTANDATANASLPSTQLSTNMVVASANGRAVGGDTPPAMFDNGSVAVGGPYDGIVTLNAAAPYQFTRPANAAYYDAQTGVEHEMDEILGLGSYLNASSSNRRPQDLFSWSAPGVRNTSTSGTRYFSINGGQTPIINFSQLSGYDYGDWESEPCPQSNPYVQNAFGCKGQAEDISLSSPEGINLDVIGYDLITPTGQLLNISTRMEVLTGDRVLIAGFIVTGTQSKKIMVRGIGPSLPVPGPLVDPTLELHQGSATIASNDNWKINDATGQSQQAEIVATGLPPNDDLESAILVTVNPGSYTAILAGKNGGTGIGLVEVYDLAQSADARLANISSRGFVDVGDNVMIGGLTVGGPTGQSGRVLVRALGPSLTNAGVSDELSNPELELHDSNGGIIASNDDWKLRPDGSSQEAEIQATNLPPSNDLESALVRILPPGAYTAIVRGHDSATGIGLVEAYNLQ